MRDIVRNPRVLSEFALSNVMLVFDFDGTLAPIVGDPRKARMRRRTAKLLSQASRVYPCAVLSGRARHEIVRLVERARVDCIVGNHGLEWGAEGIERAEVQRWRTTLEAKLGAMPGVVIEDKGYSIAVHFRNARHRSAALPAIRRAVAQLGRVRVVGGAEAVNLVPRGEPNKGDALVRIRRLFGCDSAIYVGDDDTDEDVFSLDEPFGILGIRVGSSRKSRAEYFVKSQNDVDRLLDRLVRLRSGRWRAEGTHRSGA